ncbi:MAG TPA: BON domain-containing protein [Candidatus Aquilonibacter sp.]|nr:BON domain-containing protein [Candidatus Aquilonibacter sp.]
MNRFGRSYTRILALACCAMGLAVATPVIRAQNASDAQILQDAQRQLKDKKFSGVHVQVQGGVVELTGQVDRYADKADAEKRIDKMHEATSVRNEISVAGAGSVSDAQLFQTLSKKLLYDREGYAEYPFNSITLQVHDGVVTIGGVVVEPVDKDSALGIVKNTPGVRDVIDHLQVAPVSPMDNRIRAEEYRAIYGFPQFTKYAINPAKPIRIVVVNGHVTLTGVVDSVSDRDQAGIRANSVPGVFSVTNDIQVAGQNEH